MRLLRFFLFPVRIWAQYKMFYWNISKNIYIVVDVEHLILPPNCYWKTKKMDQACIGFCERNINTFLEFFKKKCKWIFISKKSYFISFLLHTCNGGSYNLLRKLFCNRLPSYERLNRREKNTYLWNIWKLLVFQFFSNIFGHQKTQYISNHKGAKKIVHDPF